MPFEKGEKWTGNRKGRPKGSGSVSIRDAIKRRLKENPKLLDSIVEEYLNDSKHRDLLWKMLDGMPKQQVDMDHNIPQSLIEFLHGDIPTDPDATEGETTEDTE